MKKFVIHSPYEPSGDQPAAIERLVSGITAGLACQTLLGVTGSGKTFTIAKLIESVQRPAIILAPNKTLAAQFYAEMREFFPENAVEYFVSYYDYYQPEAYVPSTDTYIEKDSSINEHIEQMRLSATKAILERKDTIIVASVSAIYGLGDPKAYLSMVLHLSRGERINQRNILHRLTEMQYKRNDLGLVRATYRVQGDVIDIFPADSEREAVRLGIAVDAVLDRLEDVAGGPIPLPPQVAGGGVAEALQLLRFLFDLARLRLAGLVAQQLQVLAQLLQLRHPALQLVFLELALLLQGGL